MEKDDDPTCMGFHILVCFHALVSHIYGKNYVHCAFVHGDQMRRCLAVRRLLHQINMKSMVLRRKRTTPWKWLDRNVVETRCSGRKNTLCHPHELETKLLTNSLVRKETNVTSYRLQRILWALGLPAFVNQNSEIKGFDIRASLWSNGQLSPTPNSQDKNSREVPQCGHEQLPRSFLVSIIIKFPGPVDQHSV